MCSEYSFDRQWLTYGQFLAYKRYEMAGENQMPSDFFEKLVHDFATRLGFQVRFENTTPRVLKTQIQIQSLAGAVQVEGDLHSVMGWLKDRVATQQSIDLMLVEHKELTRLFS